MLRILNDAQMRTRATISNLRRSKDRQEMSAYEKDKIHAKDFVVKRRLVVFFYETLYFL